MSRFSPQDREPTPELRMLWYPHLPEGTLNQEILDEAMRRSRRERAEMLSTLTSHLAASIRRALAALFQGLALMQERRAKVALARNLRHPAVSGYQAAARGELPGPVFHILSHPEPRVGQTDCEHGGADDPPRLAA